MDLSRPRRDTELALVGCMIYAPDTIGVISEMVQAHDVYHKDISAMYVATMNLWESGEPIEPATVAANLPDGVSDDLPYEAHGSIGSASLAPNLAKRVSDKSQRRRMMAEARAIIKAAKEDDRDVVDVLGDGVGRMLALSLTGGEEDLGEVIQGVYRRSEEAAKSGQPGIPWAWRKLTNMTGGKMPGQMIVLGARPSVGKSAFVKNDVLYVLEHTPKRVALFSPEMKKPEVIVRMVSELSGLDSNRIIRGDLSSDQWIQYNQACEKLTEIAKGRLVFCDRTQPSCGYITSKVRQEERNGGIDIVYVDFFQKLKMPDKKHTDTERLAALSYAVFDMAGDLGIPVVMAAQINRQAEVGSSMRQPGLSDLKGTGALEECADVAVLLHRESREAVSGTFSLAKQRNGPTGGINVRYDGATTSFREA